MNRRQGDTQQAETSREDKGAVPGRNEDRGSGEVRGASAQSSKAEPRLYSCTAPERAGKSPIFSQGGIASAQSSHPDGQVGQYLPGLFWKLRNAEHQPPETGS